MAKDGLMRTCQKKLFSKKAVHSSDRFGLIIKINWALTDTRDNFISRSMTIFINLTRKGYLH